MLTTHRDKTAGEWESEKTSLEMKCEWRARQNTGLTEEGKKPKTHKYEQMRMA